MKLDGIELSDIEKWAELVVSNGHGPVTIMTYMTPINRYEPYDRRSRVANGFIARYQSDGDEVRYAMFGEAVAKIGESRFLVDDGQTVVAYYGGPARDVRERDESGKPMQHLAKVNPHADTGWRYPNPEIDPHSILCPVKPLNNWKLSPCICYHLKVSEVVR